MKLKAEHFLWTLSGFLLLVNMAALYIMATLNMKYNAVHDSLAVETRRNMELSEESSKHKLYYEARIEHWKDRAKEYLAQAELNHERMLELEQQLHDGAAALPLIMPQGLTLPRPSQNGSSVAANQQWVAVVTPTVPRPNGQDYLNQVLRSIAAQLPSAGPMVEGVCQPLGCSVKHHVFNFVPGKNLPFQRARSTLESSAQAESFSFIEISHDTNEPPRPAGFVEKPGLSPNQRVRQQTRDVISMLRHVRHSCVHVFITEDDFVYCPQAMALIHYAIDKASRTHSNFNSIRLSYGMNGILMPCADIGEFTSYLEKEQHMMPVDLLADEWFMKVNPSARQYYGSRNALFYRYNLMKHIGSTSTFNDPNKEQNKGRGLKCGDPLKLINSFVPATAFDVAGCSEHDLSPCSSAPRESWLSYNYISTPLEIEGDMQVQVKRSRDEVPTSEVEPVADNAALVRPHKKRKKSKKKKSVPPEPEQKEHPSGFPSNGAIFKAERGASCDQTCEKYDRACTQSHLMLLNTCEEMAKYFPCSREAKTCEENEGTDQPAFDVEWKPDGMCLTKREKVFSCEGHHPKTQRICPCGPVGIHPPAPKKWWLTSSIDKDTAEDEEEEEAE